MNIVNSENGEEKAAKVLKASATTAKTKGSQLRKKQEHLLKLLPGALYRLDWLKFRGRLAQCCLSCARGGRIGGESRPYDPMLDKEFASCAT